MLIKLFCSLKSLVTLLGNFSSPFLWERVQPGVPFAYLRNHARVLPPRSSASSFLRGQERRFAFLVLACCAVAVLGAGVPIGEACAVPRVALNLFTAAPRLLVRIGVVHLLDNLGL